MWQCVEANSSTKRHNKVKFHTLNSELFFLSVAILPQHVLYHHVSAHVISIVEGKVEDPRWAMSTLQRRARMESQVQQIQDTNTA